MVHTVILELGLQFVTRMIHEILKKRKTQYVHYFHQCWNKPVPIKSTYIIDQYGNEKGNKKKELKIWNKHGRQQGFMALICICPIQLN